MVIKYEMKTIEDFDWTEMWNEAIEGSHWGQRAGKLDFWDERVDWFEELVQQSDRAGMIMSRIKTKEDYRVLDIGAGPGTTTIPLAKIVRGVTVVEPSSGMLARLKENASKHNLVNIAYLNKKWEEVEIGKGKDIEAGGHDVVIASHSLVMRDIKNALVKINDAVKRNVYIFIVAGRRTEKEGSSLWSLFNREKPGNRPDYIYLYNILYQLGIYANVEIIDANHNMQFPDLDAAVRHYKTWMNVSGDNEEKLRLYLSENLVKEEGSLWLRHTLRTAMISWRKE
ncbi:class I SAM-dependent methyltransferase [Methanophagales archaeon]|nr:MAG: class I SAM-dependent methyltransferase [Methanophagales archaeon]